MYIFGRAMVIGAMVTGVSLLGLARTTEPVSAQADEVYILPTDVPALPVVTDEAVPTSESADSSPHGVPVTPSETSGVPAPTPEPVATPEPVSESTVEDAEAEGEDAPTEPAPEVIQEDDPRWDCRTMGNRQCGTEIEGTWYLVTFDDNGHAVSIRERD